jgi:hypothetical protein
MRSPSVDDDDRDVAPRPVGEHVAHRPAVARADEQATRPLEDVAVLFAREADRRGIDDRHHLVRVVDQQAEEERLVAVVQVGEVDVLLERRRLAAQVLEDAPHLLLLREHARRQQPAQA